MLLSPALLLTAVAGAPLTLHPANPHLFSFGGQPTVLITSGEHYGAVLNLDFDFVPYLAELARDGLNLTRTFAGTYREIPGSFGIKGNTLAPARDRFCCPWAASDQPGYRYGGPKFDLTRFNDAYFARLKAFVGEAATHGIVVEYVLFCPFYNNDLWLADPMHVSNNVNGLGAMPLEEVFTQQHAELQAVQEAFVRKAVTELNGFANVYFEICNEPYFGGVTLAWQRRMAQVITETEAGLPQRHLIAQNIANNTADIHEADPHVSIFNFHYAHPPVAVTRNWALNRPISFDETGFAGSDDRTYRAQAWEFLLAGGGAFSNLDYSFTPDAEAGTAKPEAPGGGGRTYRQQLGALKKWLESFDLVGWKPLPGWLHGPLDQGLRSYAATDGKSYGLYLHADAPVAAGATVTLPLPAGVWKLSWLDPSNGKVTDGGTITAAGERTSLKLPALGVDLALKASP